VVIKQIRDDLAARPETAPLLRAEAEAVQRLTHGNIVQVFDFGVDDGAPYLVMEHVDGATLADLAGSERLAVAAALFVVESVCAALEYAHTRTRQRPLGLVHRDVTPSNILVSRDGRGEADGLRGRDA
jgi:serine/threonine protein kinase